MVDKNILSVEMSRIGKVHFLIFDTNLSGEDPQQSGTMFAKAIPAEANKCRAAGRSPA